jgi:hypothetical protein
MEMEVVVFAGSSWAQGSGPATPKTALHVPKVIKKRSFWLF